MLMYRCGVSLHFHLKKLKVKSGPDPLLITFETQPSQLWEDSIPVSDRVAENKG